VAAAAGGEAAAVVFFLVARSLIRSLSLARALACRRRFGRKRWEEESC